MGKMRKNRRKWLHKIHVRKFKELDEADNLGKTERDSSGLKKDKQYTLKREELSWELQVNKLSYLEMCWNDMIQFVSI